MKPRPALDDWDKRAAEVLAAHPLTDTGNHTYPVSNCWCCDRVKVDRDHPIGWCEQCRAILLDEEYTPPDSKPVDLSKQHGPADQALEGEAA